MTEVAVKKQAALDASAPSRWSEGLPFRGSLFDLKLVALRRQFSEEMDRSFGQAAGDGSSRLAFVDRVPLS